MFSRTRKSTDWKMFLLLLEYNLIFCVIQLLSSAATVQSFQVTFTSRRRRERLSLGKSDITGSFEEICLL